MPWSVDSLPVPPGTRASNKKEEVDTAHPDPPPLPPHQRTTSFQGRGLAVLRSDSSLARSPRAIFSHLEFAFPLKLIHPRTSSHNANAQIQPASNAVAALYIVSYGGGLVSGDQVELDIDVGSACTLLTLTQGSTKVFKMRTRSATRKEDIEWTSQYFRYLVRPEACLLVLPDPVTPYSSARYAQTQRFDIRSASTSSLLVLDWFTPGRVYYDPASPQQPVRESKARRSGKEGELWDFLAYSSRNEFRIEGKVIARDALLLDNPSESDRVDGSFFANALAHAMHPFTAYGTLFLFASRGPIQSIVVALRAEFAKVEQRRVRRCTPLAGSNMPASAEAVYGQADGLLGHVLWSLSDIPFTLPLTSSPIQSQNGGTTSAAAKTGTPHTLTVLRLAGTTTEAVRRWLELRLTPLQDLVGLDLYRTALGGG
ncbi:hypothetical protein V8E36_004746 [Tilletia maclaganii]